MKKSSLKYVGVAAAALLAVAPLAAPAASAAFAPVTVSAATGDAMSTADINDVKSAMSKDFVNKNFTGSDVTDSSAAATWLTANPQNNETTNSIQAIDAKTFKAAPFYSDNSKSDYTPSSKPAYFTYTVTGGGLTAGASKEATVNALQTAPAGTVFTVTVNAYDGSNVKGSSPINTVSFTYTKVNATTPTYTNKATGTFKPATVTAGTVAPGTIGSYGSAVADASVKNTNGDNVTINANTDVDGVYYSATPVTDPSKVATGVDTISSNGLFDKGNYANNGVFYQVLKLNNKSTPVVDLTNGLADAQKNQDPKNPSISANGQVNGSDLYFENGVAYLVRKVTVKAADFNLAVPAVRYQHDATGAAFAYQDGANVTLNTGDYYDLNQSADNNTVAALTANINKVITDKNSFFAYKDGKSSTDADKIGVDNAVTAAQVKNLANAAGAQTYTAKDANGADQDYFTNTTTFAVKLNFTNKAGLTTSVYVNATAVGKQGATTDANAPVFDFTGTVQNPTLKVGDSFNALSGVTAYTNNQKNGVVQTVTVSGDTVDTSKAGVYNVKLTATNPAGISNTVTRVVTVASATDATKPVSEKGTIYVTTANAPVYNNYDGKTQIKTLALNKGFKYDKVLKNADGSVAYYNLGGNQWVKASDVSTTKPATGLKKTSFKSVGKVNYVKGYGIVARHDATGSIVKGSNKKFLSGTSWKTAFKATVNGKTYYDLGGNQWVSAQYFDVK